MPEKKKITATLRKKVLNRIKWLDFTAMKLRDRKNCIYSYQLEKEFDLQGTQVRDIIRDLRRDGEWIRPTSKGYHWAITDDEKEDLINHLDGKGMSMVNTANCLRKKLAKERRPVKQEVKRKLPIERSGQLKLL